MGDYLIELGNNAVARRALKTIGVPTPKPLSRVDTAHQDRPLAGRRVLLAGSGALGEALRTELRVCGADLTETAGEGEDRLDAVVFDATGVAAPADLKALYRCFHNAAGCIAANGRVLVLTGLPESATGSMEAACRRGVEGFVRSLAKELGRRGATANLLYVDDDAHDRVAGPVRFFLSDHSAYVDGQPLRITARARAPGNVAWSRSLAGKTALVTGAARGIGAATAQRLAREGAQVICLDVPGSAEALEETAGRIGGQAFPLDVTAEDAPDTIVERLAAEGGADVVVHNAGITRDKTLAKMPEHYWDQLMAINLEAILRINERLDGAALLRDEGRVICLSSIGGIAGNVGQTNYATAKAALIGYVWAEAQRLGERGITVNAVAPGFIETQMTAAMPFVIREFGRRLNALSQGGTPQDVAEAITFLATPGASGVTGNTLRVCGQSLIGA